MYFVAGASGRTGSRLVHLLAESGHAVRALVRNPAKSAALAALPGVEVVAGNLNDPAATAALLRGASGAALILPNGPDQLRLETGFYDAAVDAGVQHVVKLSSMEAHADAPNPVHRTHHEAEEHLKASGVEWTIVRTSFYFQNFLNTAPRIRSEGILSLPVGRGRATMTDVADAAAAMAAALLDTRHRGRSYDVTGPELLDFDEVAGRISRVAGREVRYVPEDPVAYKARLSRVIPSAWHVDAVCDIFREIADGYFVEPTDGFHALTGREPTSIDTFLEAHRSQFATDGVRAG
jgi:uncharacterized protein YbjT (DUF2867 family)